SIIGWYNYLHGDNATANALIKRDNPEMTDGQIAYSIAAMKEWGIVESGDAADLGIGCMTDERQRIFYEDMVAAGVLPGGLDYTRAFTTQFVCSSVGMDATTR